MVKRIYAVCDRKAFDIVGPAMLLAGDAIAIRQIIDVVKGPESILSMHPRDFVLMCYGEFVVSADMLPVMTVFPEPVVVCEVVDLVSPPKNVGE